MGRSKAQRAIPVTLALVSNTSMSTSKYEGCFKGLQMGDQQKLEKKCTKTAYFSPVVLPPTTSNCSTLSITPLQSFEVAACP